MKCNNCFKSEAQTHRFTHLAMCTSDVATYIIGVKLRIAFGSSGVCTEGRELC